MHLFLIRHAQSENNARPAAQRVEDPGLTDRGCEQARHLVEWIPSLRLTRLISSPFRRTLETTARIYEATGLTPDVRTELHEKGGCYRGHTPENIVGRPGMCRAEIESDFPGFRVASDIDGQGWWRSRPHEDEDRARIRAGKLLQQTLNEFGHTNERIAYVMHADIKLLFLEHLHPGPRDTPCNTSVTTIHLVDSKPQLAAYNGVEHLPVELVTK